MINQTEFVNHLKKRMHESYEKEFYLESITCSYAIVENRTKRLLNHLNKSANSMSLDKKTEYLYNQIKSPENSMNEKKLSYIYYRLKKVDILNVEDNYNYRELVNLMLNNHYDCNSQKLIDYRMKRNELAHELATYDNDNPELIDFKHYKNLAFLGIEISTELSRICSRVKTKFN